MDLAGDGRADKIFLTQGHGAATIRVEFASPAHKTQIFRFVVDPDREDAICALPVHLEVESIKNVKGFALVDERCDSIHFFWNRSLRLLDWWRE